MTMRREALFVASLLFLSCEQHEGERCQRNDGKDCASGLICCKPAGASATSSGVCKRASECTEADATTDTEEDTAPDVADVQEDEVEEAPEESADAPAEDTAAEDTAAEDTAAEETPADGADGTDAADMAEQR
jgi:hypothetical protein